jgi:hypothetical protein
LDQIHDTQFLIMLNAWKQVYERLQTRTVLLGQEVKMAEEILNTFTPIIPQRSAYA